MSGDLFGHAPPAVLPPDGQKGQLERGAFFTPPQLALACAQALRDEMGLRPTSVFEPGVGGGAFMQAAACTWPAALLYGVDLLPACDGPGVVEKRDLFSVGWIEQQRFTAFGEGWDLILGNPDFSIAERVLRHCLGLVADGGSVALLLRLGFEASQERIALFRDYPLAARACIPQRPTFTGGATDLYDYGLFVWRAGWSGRHGALLPPLVWRR